MVSYKSMSFPNDLSSIDGKIGTLFENLMHNLVPMAKQGAMSGRCEIQTEQMQDFLRENFNFMNIPGEYIVQGVKSFQIGKPISSLNDNLIIKFPSEESENSFEMSIEEIKEWQKSYIVYASNDEDLSISKEFLVRSLKGESKEGDEAFKMKFVCRISTCPILMEFDGKIIPRKLNENWPNKIKLVSVTGIDFAGRIHDINDILTYINNWRDIYHIDHLTDKPFIYNGRDFIPKKDISTQINEDILFKDLIRMAYLRFYAYNQEKIEIVVETGIGLGVFAGKQIGIDHQTRLLSAKAIKYVIEQYGSTFTNINGIIFAMPIFEIDETTSTFYYFTETFKNKYSGSIPILIIDQDMHRLTVYIAKQNFIVSELNPADSHGVFGEYWQNFGPAVEEKLALTTLGLLIQHHLFNQNNILNHNNYQLVQTSNIQLQHTILSLPIFDQNMTQISKFNLGINWIWHWIYYILFFWTRK